MVMQQNAYPVSFEGKGFTVQNSGDYREGEFKRLHNMELLSGRITSRRDILGITNNTSTLVGSEKSKFIGSFNDYAIYSGPNCQYAVNVDGSTEIMWDPTLMGPSNQNFFERLVGFFKYNHVNYWINYFQREGNDSPDNDSVGIQLRYQPDTIMDSPGDYPFLNMSTNGNQIELLRNEADVKEAARYPEFQFRNFFTHRDRLWIVLNDRIHFSATFDPTLFEVADGGGFLALEPGSRINHAFGLNDNIYVLCDDSVYVFNYSIDPNDETDLTNSRITNDFGADYGCAFRNTPYIINKEGIFEVNNQFVKKVLDNKFDTGENDFDQQKIVPFREYLVVNKSHLKQEIEFTGTDAYRENLLRNPNFQFTTKAPPAITRSEFHHEDILDIVNSNSWTTTGMYPVKGVHITEQGTLYSVHHMLGTSGGIRVNKAKLTYGPNGRITGVTNVTIGWASVWPNSGNFFKEITGIVANETWAYIIGRRSSTTSSLQTTNTLIMVKSGDTTHSARRDFYPESNQVRGNYILGYDRINNRLMVAHGPTTSVSGSNVVVSKINIQLISASQITTDLGYYSINSAVWANRPNDTKICDALWSLNNNGVPSVVMRSKGKIYAFPMKLVTSPTSFDESLGVVIQSTLEPHTFPSNMASTKNMGSDIAFPGKGTGFHFRHSGKFYTSSEFTSNLPNRHAMFFYQKPDGTWESFRKESIIIAPYTYWHLRPVGMPEGYKFRLYLSSNELNWYLAIESSSLETFCWDGDTSYLGAFVPIGSLPISMTHADYLNPQTTLPEYYGYNTDSFNNASADVNSPIRFYEEAGVLKVYNVKDHGINGNLSYEVVSDRYSNRSLQYSLIPVEAGKRYTISCKTQFSSPKENPFDFTSEIRLKSFNSAQQVDNTVINIVNTNKPIVTNAWQTVSITFETEDDGFIAYSIGLNLFGDSPIWNNHNYDNSFEIKERIMEESSTFDIFFDGSTNGYTNLVYWWTSEPHHLSTSKAAYLGSSDRNLVYPFYDKVRSENAGNKYHTNLIFINMDEGTIHSAGIDDIPGIYNDKIVDIHYNGDSSSATNYPSLYMLGVRPDGKNLSFFMRYDHSDRPTDRLYAEGSMYPENIMPIYLLDIDSITPDGTEYNVKKFRNLEIMGKFPHMYMRLYVAYDDRPYPEIANSFADSVTSKVFPVADKLADGSARPHFPHRMGLNQRARAVSLKATNLVKDVAELQKTQYDKFEISTIRLLWSPTQRSSSGRNNL